MKDIVDVCCGSKMFYFTKENEHILYCDKRALDTKLCDGRTLKVRPDMITDFTNLPFNDNHFSVVIFDPPHLVKAGDSSWLVKKYGKLDKEYKEELTKAFNECFRVLKPFGVLVFKWSDVQVNVREILPLAPELPIFGDKRGDRRFIVFIKGAGQKEN